MNIKMIIGAIKSPKTPKHLKKALAKKYAKQLASYIEEPKSIQGQVGEVYAENPKGKFEVGDIISIKSKRGNINEGNFMITQIKNSIWKITQIATGREEFYLTPYDRKRFIITLIDKG